MALPKVPLGHGTGAGLPKGQKDPICEAAERTLRTAREAAEHTFGGWEYGGRPRRSDGNESGWGRAFAVGGVGGGLPQKVWNGSSAHLARCGDARAGGAIVARIAGPRAGGSTLRHRIVCVADDASCAHTASSAAELDVSAVLVKRSGQR